MNTIQYFIWISTACLLVSCINNAFQPCNLNWFSDEYETNAIVAYRHISKVDNRFNSTVQDDTTYVTLFSMDNTMTGFQMMRKDFEWIYDGRNIIELNHRDKTKSIEPLSDPGEISLWNKNLLSIIDSLTGKFCEVKYLHNIQMQYHVEFYSSNSKVDSTEIVHTTFEYFIPRKNIDSLSHKQIVVRADDTLQIQHHYYDQIRFISKKNLDSIANQVGNNDYADSGNEATLPFGKAPVREGDSLQATAFPDIHKNTIQILPQEKEYALVIFSFIGCTPCEIALHQLEEDKYGIRTKANLYYSSFQDNNEAIQKYLKDKPIFDHAFAKESQMIDVFRLPVAPTFVLIDSKGKIIKVIEGYDQSVLKSISAWLKP